MRDDACRSRTDCFLEFACCLIDIEHDRNIIRHLFSKDRNSIRNRCESNSSFTFKNCAGNNNAFGFKNLVECNVDIFLVCNVNDIWCRIAICPFSEEIPFRGLFHVFPGFQVQYTVREILNVFCEDEIQHWCVAAAD